jgi:hypothetical protein
MKTVNINLQKLHNLESGQFIERFFLDFQGTGLNINADPEFKIIYNDLLEQTPIYKAALAQVFAKQESELLYNLDQKRDKKLSALRLAYNVYRDTEDAPKSAAFAKLKPLMKSNKNLANENYEAESLGADNFILALRSADFLPAVTLLNMVEHVNNLATSNNLFKTTFNSRSNATISTIVYDTKMLKKKIFATYKELVNYSFTMANRRTPSPYFVTVSTAINNGRTYFANIIARRDSNPEEETPAVG